MTPLLEPTAQVATENSALQNAAQESVDEKINHMWAILIAVRDELADIGHDPYGKFLSVLRDSRPKPKEEYCGTLGIENIMEMMSEAWAELRSHWNDFVTGEIEESKKNAPAPARQTQSIAATALIASPILEVRGDPVSEGMILSLNSSPAADVSESA
ncbi:MAG: hypothetical protein HOO67_07305 [Candidatus Peribacteraceae bacterium]|nr:hypothetical protein [Candidatus Peribacteraceae bacterium]